MQRLWRSLLVTAAALGTLWPIERAAAQEYLGGLNYSVGIPTGDTKTFTNNESWLGLAFEGQWIVRPNASAGITLGWNEFYERTGERPLVLENGTITGQQYRHLNVFPMLVTGRMYLNRDQRIDMSQSAYLGLSGGGYYVRQMFSMGTSQLTTDGWLFGLAPEVGVLFPLSMGNLGTINARYHIPMNSSEFLGGDVKFQYWTISIGVAHSM